MTADPLASSPVTPGTPAPDSDRAAAEAAGIAPGAWALDAALVSRLAGRVVAGPGAEQVVTRTPFTGGPIGRLPRSTEEDVARAVATARAAQRDWAAHTVRHRAAVLRRLHDAVLTRQSEGLDILQLETGKSRVHAFDEITDVAINARWHARRGPSILGDDRHAGLTPMLTKVTEVHQPKGVIGMISPWNYPLVLTISDAIPALLAGNAVVLKPDSQTPFTALWAADLLAEAGLPDGLFQVLYGKGAVIGTAIIDSTDYVCFTGSTATGRSVAARAAERLVGVSLELGGKNPVYVADDADLDRAAEGVVRDCFGNSGHACVSMERLILHEKIADAFLDRFVDRVRRLKLGSGLDYEADLGSIASQSQFDILVEHVEDAVGKGATVLAGGKARPEIGPLFFEPTVLDNVPADAVCFGEETFGPLVSVYRVSSDAAAVKFANATPYGLNASVWSKDRRRAARIARRIAAGTVVVNEAYTVGWGSVASPMGGMKESGLGRRHGAAGILRFTESQTIAAQKLGLGIMFDRGGAFYSKAMTGALKFTRAIRYPWP
jgi:succinate-semialdehyde dehydrogenase/glutarate-semialdehyde dehydrogenase